MLYVGGMSSLGKQVGTYLRGRTAEAFEEMREERKTTVYRLLTEAVEALLVKEGYLEPPKPKQTLKFRPSQMLAEKKVQEALVADRNTRAERPVRRRRRMAK
jgi:hypothetical protein